MSILLSLIKREDSKMDDLIKNSDYSEIYKELKALLKNSYAPYSEFNVAAAVETEDNRYFYGVNVENISYSLTMCAERIAIFNAVVNGYKKFKRVFILSTSTKPTPPCGACRQVISEFEGNPDIIMFTGEGKYYEKKNITELLPLKFDF